MGNTTHKQIGASEEFKEYYKNKSIFVFFKKTKGKKNNITFVNENIKEFTKKLKNNKNIWLLGGASITNEF